MILKKIIFSELEDKHAKLIHQTQYTQLALFILEYATAKLWQHWGIEPQVLIGHSIGELVAATFAGVFTLEDGIKLVAARGKLMQALPQEGKMVSVMAAENQVKPYLNGAENDVTIAATNTPTQTVVSGKTEVIELIVNQLQQANIKTKELKTSHAFHSPLMHPMLDEFRKVAKPDKLPTTTIQTH